MGFTPYLIELKDVIPKNPVLISVPYYPGIGRELAGNLVQLHLNIGDCVLASQEIANKCLNGNISKLIR